MKESRVQIRWFLSEYSGFNSKKHCSVDDTGLGRGLCQCQTERFIEKSCHPDKMRAFLMLSVFIDQTMYTHFRGPEKLYRDFRSRFYFPKLYSCPDWPSMARPNWFAYSFRGFDKKMNWEAAVPIAHTLLGELFTWLQGRKMGDQLVHKFKGMIEEKIPKEFEPENAKRLLEIVRQVRLPSESVGD